MLFNDIRVIFGPLPMITQADILPQSAPGTFHKIINNVLDARYCNSSNFFVRQHITLEIFLLT